ncbi:MAG TPA: glycosyltransferase [Chloroflexota bacterium]|jgi:glycosyltransferase involved in cell wall biosynthesis|nr:glycosyltransferase [Chloroflexota bacterium]
MARPRVALVHDYLNQYGGAERVLEELHALFPDAPVFTSIYWPEKMSPAIRALDVRTSFMQRLPGAVREHQRYLIVYPFAFESFDLSGYDLVISNCSAFCKGVRKRPDALHVCYCLTPMRWVWRHHAYVEREQFGRLARLGLPPVIRWLRAWDVKSNRRVDRFVAISRAVQDRITRFYRRDSTIVYPPVDTGAFAPTGGAVGDYFLVVSRLVPYKRIDLAVDACTRLGLPLKIAGSTGRDEAALRAKAGPSVEFLGWATNEQRRDLMARCKAFLFCGEDDFGITPLEVSASGRPVVAFAAGGALDTVVDGVTGVLFHEQSVDALAAAIARSETVAWDPEAIRAHALRFDTGVFRRRLPALIEEALASRPAGA